jgi:hypothetical protein
LNVQQIGHADEVDVIVREFVPDVMFVNIRTPRNAILRFRSPPSVTIESFLYLFASQLTDIIMLFFYILLLLFIVIVEATILNLPFVLQCVMDSFCFVNTKVNGILTHGEICLNDIVVVHFFFW